MGASYDFARMSDIPHNSIADGGVVAPTLFVVVDGPIARYESSVRESSCPIVLSDPSWGERNLTSYSKQDFDIVIIRS